MKTKLSKPTIEKPSPLKAVLVGITNNSSPILSSSPLSELAGLATTAHYEPVGFLVQRLIKVNPKTYIGSGKVQELIQAVKYHNADAVIFDENLSPGQTRNLEKVLSCPVVDRSWIILEIFSDHARTREAKIQVQLARLKYSLPRLTKMWTHLSRQRGGIGMRDVGETQIQLDRRIIRDQISKLEKKLKRIHKEKQTQRKSRQGVYQVALVGYTNVGKSTLMNCLTGASTLVEDKLFATLDSTIRKVKKNFPYPILLADTVGLINKLPHDLVASFKSTLDEVRDANLLLHVVDISHPDFLQQMHTAEQLLRDLGVENTPKILVFNKMDDMKDRTNLQKIKYDFPNAVFISCKKKQGLDKLRKEIIGQYEKNLLPYKVILKYDQSNLIPTIRQHALIIKEKYNQDTLTLELRVYPSHQSQLQEILNGKFSLVAS